MGDILDPMRISRHDLSLVAMKRRVKAIAFSEMEDEWNWVSNPTTGNVLPHRLVHNFPNQVALQLISFT